MKGEMNKRIPCYNSCPEKRHAKGVFCKRVWLCDETENNVIRWMALVYNCIIHASGFIAWIIYRSIDIELDKLPKKHEDYVNSSADSSSKDVFFFKIRQED